MNDLYARLLEFTRDGVYRYDFQDGVILQANAGLVRILGLSCSPDDLVGRSLRDVMVYTERVGTIRQALLATGEIHGMEYHFRTLAGEERWVLHDSFLTRAADGRQVVEAIVKDVTERRVAQEQIAAEKERLTVTLASIGDGVIATDREGRVTLMNRVAEHLTGWTAREAAGQPLASVFRIVNERTRARCESPVDKVLASGQVVDLANHTALIARDGRERIIADSGAPIRDPESRVIGVVLVFRDQTETRRLEDEAIRAQKLESLGVLAGGIAHDFNNILTGVFGNISLARTLADPGGPSIRRLDEAEKALSRARDLTQQLLTFAKGGAPIRRAAAIDALIRDTATFALSGANVRLDLQFEDDLWPVEVDPGQISQVLHNLVLNAEEAMPDGGELTVRAANQVVDGPNPWQAAPGRFVRVDVEDRGIGIPPRHLDRIFDPYFTTKKRGSGLGLAVSYSIIQNHGGRLSVRSQLGVGTVFTMLLPASEQSPDAAEAPGAGVVLGRGRVLVMDDESVVRDVVGAMLAHLGYEPVLVRDGVEAVEAWRAAKAEGHGFEALIVDLTVPGGIGGQEAVERIRAFDPDVGAIVSSGYCNDPVLAEYERHGFRGFLCKPYRVEELSRVLASVVKPAQVTSGTAGP